MAEPAAERTEEPTPRRLLEARRRGEVALSGDLGAAVVLVAALAVLVVGARSWWGGLLVYFTVALPAATRSAPGAAAGERALEALTRGLAPTLLATMVAAIAVGLLQTG